MDDRTLLAIGRVAVAAGNIEVGSYLVVWAFEYGSFPRTDALVANRNFSATAELGIRLAGATWTDPESLAAWVKLPERPQIYHDTIHWLRAAKRFMGERNQVMHSGGIDEVGLARFRPGRGSITLKVEDLEKLADEGEGLVVSSVDLVERIRHSLPRREPVYRDLADIVADRADDSAEAGA